LLISHGGRAIIANALKINATVTDIHFFDNCDEPWKLWAAVLLCNSTLQNPHFCRQSMAAVIFCNSTLQNPLAEVAPNLAAPGRTPVEGGYPQYSYPGNEYYAQETSVSILDKLRISYVQPSGSVLAKNLNPGGPVTT
jgi:hypothetical protein